MFVQCIVASEVIRVAEGVETREAMLRDMALYGLSIVGVLVFFSLGQVGAGTCGEGEGEGGESGKQGKEVWWVGLWVLRAWPCVGSASWGVGVLSETGGCRDVAEGKSGAYVVFLAPGHGGGAMPMEMGLCQLIIVRNGSFSVQHSGVQIGVHRGSPVRTPCHHPHLPPGGQEVSPLPDSRHTITMVPLLVPLLYHRCS